MYNKVAHFYCNRVYLYSIGLKKLAPARYYIILTLEYDHTYVQLINGPTEFI